VCAWGIPNHEPLQRLSSIRIPDLVANDDSDPVPSRQHASRRRVRPSWASGFAIGSFFTACAGQDLAGLSATAPKPGSPRSAAVDASSKASHIRSLSSVTARFPAARDAIGQAICVSETRIINALDLNRTVTLGSG
jgi:hypothetical protein